jgi:hypothetical protein
MEDPLLGWAGSCLDLPYRCCAEGRTLWDMDRHWRFARAEDKIARLSKQGLDMVGFWRAFSPVLTRTRAGDVWGAIGLYRMPDRPLFDVYEQAFLAAISPLIADAVRRALLIGESADPEGPDAPGMIVLGPTGSRHPLQIGHCVAGRPPVPR